MKAWVVGRWLVLTPMVVLSVGPIFWMAVQALKAERYALASGNPWWPEQPTLENFVTLFSEPDFVGWIAW